MKIVELLKERMDCDVSYELIQDFVEDYISQNMDNIHYMHQNRDSYLNALEHYFRHKYPEYFREIEIDKILSNKKGE